MTHPLNRSCGIDTATPAIPGDRLIQYINFKLAAMDCPPVQTSGDPEFLEMAEALLARERQAGRLLANYLCPADNRIQTFLYDYLQDAPIGRLPNRTFVLDRFGLARSLSLPVGREEFTSDIVHSYRVKQGVLHNPKNDRRTTKGIFHICDNGLPVPDDKITVPKRAFGRMLQLALDPPSELMRLPFTAGQEKQAECFVSLLLRPVVCPGIPGIQSEKSMEIRFFAPGNLVGNLDFVESIFGNSGDPFLPENDAALDPEQWTGHTGCIILAPHLIKVKKTEVGLPHWDDATELQRRDGMCWKDENELYNNGQSFKLTCRDETGVIVTLIADNYFGYCKKEVKTHISYSANLFGLCEEEHAGGALVFPSYDLGEEFSGELHVRQLEHTFKEMVSLYGSLMDVQPEGYAVDRKYPDIIYVQEAVHFDLQKQSVTWVNAQGDHKIKLLPGRTYVRPSGYKVHMEMPIGGRKWRLVGTVAEGTLCHKPSTVSGGGKSEISKPITDAIIQGPVFVADYKNDFNQVAELLEYDYTSRFRDPEKNGKDQRAILSPERSLGSVIKLLTSSELDYSDEYNAWLETIPQHIKELLFVLKRFYKLEWGADWRNYFSVDIINGTPANELKCENRKLATNYLRVGFEQDGAWRTFGLRKDFQPAVKLQMEDDITASVVMPVNQLENLNPDYQRNSVKFVENCEYRLFQRPDDAIHRGYDKRTEADFALPGNFFSNYEPLTVAQAVEMTEDSIGFEKYTEPMQKVISESATGKFGAYFVASSNPRIVEGKPSKNPRYLQTRPDLLNPRALYLAQVCIRFRRRIPLGKPVYTPVDALLPGRRNNPPEPGVRPLAVFSPIHYLELPELFMEFICSMTGKSPSTTGAGSEGALTKGPFNALPPIIDLNAALVSKILTGIPGFITAAGYVGPNFRVDHDVSLLAPELWSRMTVEERDPAFLIADGCLEKCADFEHNGKSILASRLGYRITKRFVTHFFGRLFNHPGTVFSDEMLHPELQSMDIFVDGMENIVQTQKVVAQSYFNDGSIAAACPPLRALLHIMAFDQYEGKDLNHPEVRALFNRDNMLASDWYAERLAVKQRLDICAWEQNIDYLKAFLSKSNYADEARRLGIAARYEYAIAEYQAVKSPDFLRRLHGTIGVQPLKVLQASQRIGG